MGVEHTFLGKDGPVTKTLTTMRAIREKCLNCCCWSPVEVAKCGAEDCPLYPYRFGKRPDQAGQCKKIQSRVTTGQLARDLETISS